MLHIAGSTLRLVTYLQGRELSAAQLAALLKGRIDARNASDVAKGNATKAQQAMVAEVAAWPLAEKLSRNWAVSGAPVTVTAEPLTEALNCTWRNWLAAERRSVLESE